MTDKQHAKRMNTRKYPRTLNDTFPHTAEYASAVERSRKDDRLILRGSMVIAIIFVFMAVAGWLD